MKLRILFFCCLAFFVSAKAQNVIKTTIQGKLIDGMTKQAIPYATVTLKDEAMKSVAGSITGDKGEFFLDTIPVGSYSIEFQFIGYKPLQKTIVLKAKLDLGTLSLQEDATLLKEISVKGEQTTVSLKLDKKTFLVGKDVLTQNGSVNDLLNGVPSVSVDPAGGISLRGNSNVNVLVNGRKTGLTQGNMLDQIPADQIEKVEVITNPSARYDAAGSAGIINLVLKKNKKGGFNGQLKVVAGLPNDTRVLPSINYKSDKINLFSTFGYRNSDYVGLYKTNQISTLPGLSTYSNILSNENRHDDGKNLYLGADFYLNDKNTITTAFFKNDTHDSDKIRLGYDYSKTDLGLDSSLLRNGTSSEIRDYNQLEFNYTRTFVKPGKKWTIDVLYDFWNSDKDWALSTQKLFPVVQNYMPIRTSSDGSSKDFLIQTDLVLPLQKNQNLELGIKAETRSVTSDFIAEQLSGNVWSVYQGINNKLNYREKIGSAYLQFSNNLGKLSYMLGLRTELTGVDIEDRTKIYTNKKEYSRLFPSVNASYPFKENATLQLNYSKRINRPSLGALYPFNEVTDLNSQFVGNPNLNPSYADVFELGFLKVFKTLTINPSVYAQLNRGVIQDYTFRNANGIFISTPINIEQETRRGIELSVLYNPAKWMNVNGELNAFDFKQKGIFNGEDLDFSGNAVTARLSLQLKFPKQFSIQTRYNFVGAKSNAQTKTKAINYADLGISKTLFKDKASVVLDGTNIFNSRQNKTSTKGENYVLNQISNFNAERYRLSFTYRFNLKSEQSIRQAKSGNRN